MLTGILTYHVVPGRLTVEDIRSKAAAGGGTYTVTSVQGEPLTFRVDRATIFVTDAKGHTAKVTIPDVIQSNGVIHGIDTVLMPM